MACASSTLFRQIPTTNNPTQTTTNLLLRFSPHRHPRTLSLKTHLIRPKTLSLKTHFPERSPRLQFLKPCSSSLSAAPNTNQNNPSSFFTLLLSISHHFLNSIRRSAAVVLRSATADPSAEEYAQLQSLRQSLVRAVGPLFFASISEPGSGNLSTPLNVIAAGISRWMDMYSGVLLLRVLLSWFPNIPWDRQPLSAIRDLCDPFLSVFRGIIPPIFGTLDLSPLLAFYAIGFMRGILISSY